MIRTGSVWLGLLLLSAQAFCGEPLPRGAVASLNTRKACIEVKCFRASFGSPSWRE